MRCAHKGRSYESWNEGLKNQLDIYLFVYISKLDEWAKLSAWKIQVIWESGLHPGLDKTSRRDFSFRADALVREINRDLHNEPVDLEVRKTSPTRPESCSSP